MPTCWHCKAESPAAHHDRVVYNRTELHGPWSGWRMAGARLISPHGEWIAPHLLDRWLYRHARMFQR